MNISLIISNKNKFIACAICLSMGCERCQILHFLACSGFIDDDGFYGVLVCLLNYCAF